MRIKKFQKIIISIVNLMGREVIVDLKVGNPFSSGWFYLIRFTTFVLHPLIWLVMRFLFQIIYKWIPICFLLKRLLKLYAMGSHISFLLKNFFSQIICKLVPMSSFPKISMKLQVVDPTHEQIKYVQSSIKSTQVWSSIKNFSFQTNPLPTNLIDSNQPCLGSFMEVLE
jgi:hypothetical protein